MLRISDITYSVEGRPLFEGRIRHDSHRPQGRACRSERNRQDDALPPDPGRDSRWKVARSLCPRAPRSAAWRRRCRHRPPRFSTRCWPPTTERAALMDEADHATDPHRIAEIQHRLADIDAWSAEGRASAILRGLGFEPEEQQLRPCSDFSGGWRMRVALAGVLFAQPDLPPSWTNPRTISTLKARFVAGKLSGQIPPHGHHHQPRPRPSEPRRGLDPASGKPQADLLVRAPTTSSPASGRNCARCRQAEAKKQDARRAHLQSFVDRFKAKASKAVQAQSRVKMLEKMTPILAPEETPGRSSSPSPNRGTAVPADHHDGRRVRRLWRSPPVLKRLSLRIDQDDRIALLGRNGEGKSTLSKLLAGQTSTALKARWRARPSCASVILPSTRSTSCIIDETPLQHIQRLRPNEAPGRNSVPVWPGFGLDARTRPTLLVDRLSGGQKARLSLLLATIEAPHLLILDEPTNHLDIESREALVDGAYRVCGCSDPRFSHDMHLLGLVADRLWLVKGGAVAPLPTIWTPTARSCWPATSRKSRRKAKGKAPRPSPKPCSRSRRGSQMRGKTDQAERDARQAGGETRRPRAV